MTRSSVITRPGKLGRAVPSFTRRTFFGAAATFAVAPPVLPQSARSGLVAYQTFAKQQLQLRPFPGRNVVLLLAPTRQSPQVAIDRVLSAVDRGWDWYKEMFGRSPKPFWTHAGKATIAEVSDNDGAAGRGFLGHTGVQVLTKYMDLILEQAARDLQFQLLFYELGRNFWFYDEPLGGFGNGVFTTGFAHVNRFYCMDAIGVRGGPWGDGLAWDVSRHDVLVDLLDRYLTDPTLTWRNTLAEYKAPDNPRKWDGAALAASLFNMIRRDHDLAGYRRFWKLMMGAPKAEVPHDSVGRFVQIARAATGADYRALLRDGSLPLTIKTMRVPPDAFKRIVYHGRVGQTAVKGQVARTAGNEWIETNDYQGGSRFVFRSISEIASEIVLYDETRDIYLSLDLSARKTWWRRGPDPAWNVQFDFVSIQSKRGLTAALQG